MQSRLVYSTDGGTIICPGCRKAVARCVCAPTAPEGLPDGIVRVALEKKGRAGKGVTLISGLALDAAALGDLCKRLKTSCGAGGTVKHGVIELQGDQRNLVTPLLAKQGWSVKRVGG